MPLLKPLQNLAEALGLSAQLSKYPGEQVNVTGLAYDSRSVQPGNAFFCLSGQKFDGNQFIADVIAKGASCTFSEKPYAGNLHPHFIVQDIRQTLAAAANYFFDYPSTKLRLIGVTGTKGKTTTTHLVEHILSEAGKNVGLIGTLGARWTVLGDTSPYKDLHHTTPQTSDLQQSLSEMVDRGMQFVSMEVSSHALALKRVAGCNFSTVCLTNITHDHLDFHKTIEDYWKAKRILFEDLNQSKASNKTAIVNADDALAPEFRKVVGKDCRTWSYGWNKEADACVKKADFNFNGTTLEVTTPMGNLDLKLQLNGRFNVYNVLAALLICLAEGIPLAQCKAALENFKGVPGRFEIVSSDTTDGAEPLCIVDYAHTADSLDNILRTARPLVPKNGKLITVFGCGGDRDTTKRPLMAKIAEKEADEVIITSDNPRTEDPAKIIEDILAGIADRASVHVEPDRAKAIQFAVSKASHKDVIVVAGKGHETYQILKDRTIDFDDRLIVKQALAARTGAHQNK